MKNYFLFLLLVFSLSLSAFSQDNKTEAILHVDEARYFEQMLSVIKDNIEFLSKEQIETGDMKSRYAEANNLFFSLRNSSDIKDFNLTKRYLTTLVADLVQESEDRVAFVQRMELLYWMMLSIGLFIVFLMLIYSIYMYSRRK